MLIFCSCVIVTSLLRDKRQIASLSCIIELSYRWTLRAVIDQKPLLYLPTQIRFLIGGERVTCHWSKLNDPLGRTKLNDALGQQHRD